MFVQKSIQRKISTFNDLIYSDKNKEMTPNKNRHKNSMNNNQTANSINKHIKELQVMKKAYRDMATVNNKQHYKFLSCF